MKRTFKYCSKKCRIAPRFRGKYCIQCGEPIIVDLGSSHRVKHCSTSCSRKTVFERNNPGIDEDYFAIPNLENSYWAGFIAADGYISQQDGRSRQLIIGLEASDGHHLEKIKKSIGAGKVIEYKSKSSKNGKTYFVARYRVSSDKICKDLEENFGVMTRKTFTLERPELDGDLAYAFIAGYIDGDGSYRRDRSRPRLTIVGTRDILSWIGVVCEINKSPRPDGNIFRYDITGDQAINIRDSFRDLNLPLLERKKNRWEELGLNLEIL